MVGKSQWFRRLKLRRTEQSPAWWLPTIRLPILLTLGLILAFAAGCSRPSELPADERVNQSDHRKLPFENSTAKGNAGSNPGLGNSGETRVDSVSNGGPQAAAGAPFQSPSSVPDLPPGTLVTVRVESQISIHRTGEDRTGEDRTGEEGTFAGVVDEPVVMDGKIALPRGATVTGRIEAAPASDGGSGRGYIRLTLDTITIAGKTLPLRTSSLFVRGTAGEVASPGQNQGGPDHPAATRLQKGRRLTFRLAATLPRDREETVSSSQNRPASTE